MNELPYCSCVGPRRRGNQPRTKVCTGEMENSSTSKQLLQSCLTHLSLGTYVRTYLFLLLHNGNLFYHFNCYPHHSLAQTQTQKLQAKYLTLPTQNFKLSIHPVRELVAGCSDSRSKTHKRHPGGEVANNDDGGLPYYPSWVISQRRRSWCCSMGRWASSYGGLCLLFMNIMYKSGKIR